MQGDTELISEEDQIIVVFQFHEKNPFRCTLVFQRELFQAKITLAFLSFVRHLLRRQSTEMHPRRSRWEEVVTLTTTEGTTGAAAVDVMVVEPPEAGLWECGV
jgi:hypothetical protein